MSGGNDRALDFSATHPDADLLVGWNALSYLGKSRPSMAYLAELAHRGIPFTFIFEQDPNQSQRGYRQGVIDAKLGDQRGAEVGYPDSATYAVVVSDGSSGDPNPRNSDATKIADYAEAWLRTSVHPIMFYGNRYAVDAAIAGARRVPGAKLVAGPNGDGGWLPRTWGADPARDPIIQEPNIASPIGGTDFNSVHHDYTSGGAPAPAPKREDESVIVVNSDTREAIWVVGNLFARSFTGDGPFGIPQSAIDFAGDPREIPIRLVNGIEWFVLQRASDIAKGDFVPGRDKDKPGDGAGAGTVVVEGAGASVADVERIVSEQLKVAATKLAS